MKKKVSVLLALTLVLCMALAACSGGGSSSAPAAGGGSSAAAGGSAPATSDEVFKMDIAVTLGEPVSPSWAKLFNQLEEDSGGRLDPTVYWSSSLVSIPEIPKTMASGGVTLANVPTPNYPDVLPLNTRILQLPFFGLQDPVDSAEIYMQLLDEFPELIDEFAQYNMYPIAVTTLGMYDLHFTDKNEVREPSDLNGRQIVPYKTEFLPMLEANNAAGSYIPPGQIYESLEKGVVNGYINNWAFQGWFGLTELIEQHVSLGEYGAFQEFNVICVNLDFYNSLPEDLQTLLVDTFRTNGGYKEMWQDTADLVANEQKKAEDKGDLFVELTEAELEVWKDAVGDIDDTVIAEVSESRGDDAAQRLYDRAKEIIEEKYGA